MVRELRDYNRWRRGDETMDQPEPLRLGLLLDACADLLERLNRVDQGIGMVGSRVITGPIPFDRETCDRHKTPLPAELVFTPRCGTYRWRCRQCGIGWVTEGTPLERHNEIAFANCTRNTDGPDHE